jgi:hypothetical protein
MKPIATLSQPNHRKRPAMRRVRSQESFHWSTASAGHRDMS